MATFDFAAQRARDLSALPNFPIAPQFAPVAPPSGGPSGGGPISPITGTGGGPSSTAGLAPNTTSFPYSLGFEPALDQAFSPIANHKVTIQPNDGSPPFVIDLGPIPAFPAITQYGLIEQVLKQGWSTFIAFIGASLLAGVLPASNPTEGTGNAAEDTIINNVTVVDQSAARAVGNVSSAVTRGIQDTINGIAAIQENTANSIEQGLTGFTNQIGAFTNNVSEFIGSALADSINKLFNPSSMLQTALQSDLGAIGNVVSGIEADIVGPLGKAISDLDVAFGGFPQDVGIQLDKVFTPLLDDLRKVFHAIISGDIGEISKIVGVLVSFFTTNQHSLADIARDLERIGVIFPGHADTYINWDDISQIAAQLKNMGAQLAGLSAHTIGEVYKPGDTLHNTCDPNIIDEGIKRLGQDMDAVPDWVKEIGRVLLWVVGQIIAIEPAIEQRLEADRVFVHQLCPITKLDPATVISLWRRGILAEDAAVSELLGAGYDEARRKALYDGTTYQPDAATLIDHWYRDIITDSGLSSGLHQLGYTDAQIEAYKTGIFKLLDPALLLQLWQRNLITEDEIRKALIVQRYTTAQIDAILVSGFRPPNVQETIKADAVRKAIGIASILGFTGLPEIPQAVKDAGRAEGLNDDAIIAQWADHWNILDPATWINLYFRGSRSITEINSALDSFYVPPLLQLDLIEANRPLIPFRTIPAMLAAGIIDESRARQILGQHGFATQDIDALIHYAGRSKTKATATTPTVVKTLSIQNARTLFDDGALTEDQYVHILEAHGYTPDLAAKQAQVDTIAAHARQRKQTLADLEAEVSVGTITVDDALAQLSGAGFTAAEIARFQSAIRRRTTANVKRPSIAELDKFLKAQLITPQQYHDELQAQGWLDPWLSAFMGLVTAPPSAPSTSPAA